MKLAIRKRSAGKKGEINRLRREGFIPAVIYGKGRKEIPISISLEEISLFLRKNQVGRLATCSFTLEGDGEKLHAIVKDVQYHPTNYAIIHLDFLATDPNRAVCLNVPIYLNGVADCAGVKLGGFLRQVERNFKVTCLPKDIPEALYIDVKDLGVGESRKLKDIALPKNVTPLAHLEEVAVVIGKKAGS